MKPIILALGEPFPHLLIEKLYDEEELKLIWEELAFLTKPFKLTRDQSFTAVDERGVPKSTSGSICLDDTYTYRAVSSILTISRKVFSPEIIGPFSEISPMCKSILHQNNDLTKVRYYTEGDEYLPHVDNFNYTIATFFYRDPKSFSGGDLHFPDYNYTCECKNNSLVLFPSCITHAVTPIKGEEKTIREGFGRYSIMQFLKLV